MHYMFLFFYFQTQVDKFCPPAWTTSTGSDAQVPVQDVPPGNRLKFLTRDLSKCANYLKGKKLNFKELQKYCTSKKSEIAKLENLETTPEGSSHP